MLGWFKKKFTKQSTAGRTEPVDKESLPVDEAHQAPSVNTVGAAQDAAIVAEKPATTDEPALDKGEQPGALPEGRQETASPEAKDTLFFRLKKRLVKTRGVLVSSLDAIFLGKKVIDADLLDELEEVLLTADLGVQTVRELLDHTRAQLKRDELTKPEVLYAALKDNIYRYLVDADRPPELVMPEQGPFVIMVLGVNGVGKTTTIGKLAYKFKQAGQSVLLVAGDTFRAAAIDQLKVWATRVGADICAQSQGVDPSSVVYDAMAHAKSRGYDVVIIDTAGRIHTKVNLIEELKKIKRVMGKHIAAAPHEVMLVLDATTGQNALSQAREFNKAVDLTGLTLTKLDGTAKGGIVINISRALNIPIRFIGIGEQMEDLRDFHPKEFVEALFAK